MAIITDTPNDENLAGTDENDLIRGLGGNDIIDGGLGDDDLLPRAQVHGSCVLPSRDEATRSISSPARWGSA
ncbi:MAG: hypothetical protein ACR2RF_27175 [Geminicoccaceae bacterium]